MQSISKTQLKTAKNVLAAYYVEKGSPEAAKYNTTPVTPVYTLEQYEVALEKTQTKLAEFLADCDEEEAVLGDLGREPEEYDVINRHINKLETRIQGLKAKIAELGGKTASHKVSKNIKKAFYSEEPRLVPTQAEIDATIEKYKNKPGWLDDPTDPHYLPPNRMWVKCPECFSVYSSWGNPSEGYEDGSAAEDICGHCMT